MIVQVQMRLDGNDTLQYHTFIGYSEKSGSEGRGFDGVISCAKAAANKISKGKGVWTIESVKSLPLNTHLV